MEGLRGYPRFKPPFPGQAGSRASLGQQRRDADVGPLIVERGADWFEEVGPVSCPGTKLFCLSGRLNRTGLVEHP